MKKVTLTFDNGPTPGVTERVLDILEKNGIKATFMVIGRNLRDQAAHALLADMAAQGHWIGNHSLTHSVALGDNPDASYAEHEIAQTQHLIGSYGHPDKFFRPFGNLGQLGPHLLSEAALAYLVQHAFTCVLWNSIPHDWDDAAGWVERGVAHVRNQDWTVTVLHDIHDASLPRLAEFIQRLRDEGVQFEQSFPREVVAVRRGRIEALPDAYISGRIGSA
jgi:peptidoglycan/xylan/chitin deacetylase (PgdA/CDA1 family)